MLDYVKKRGAPARSNGLEGGSQTESEELAGNFGRIYDRDSKIGLVFEA
jgi:hypothetical protein